MTDLYAEDGRLCLRKELVHLVEGDFLTNDGGLDLVVWVGRNSDSAVGELPSWLRVDERLELCALEVEVAADALLADRGEGALDRVESDFAGGVLELVDLGGVLANIRVLFASECGPELAETCLEEESAELRETNNQRVGEVSRGSNVLGLLDDLVLIIASERGSIVLGLGLLLGLDGDGGQWCLTKKRDAEVEVGEGSGDESLEENVDDYDVVEVGRVELVSVCSNEVSGGGRNP